MNRLLSLSIRAGLIVALFASPAFPKKAAADPSSAKAGAKPSGGKTAPASPVDLNSATQAQLESVPGIGTPTAKRIIAGRPYGSVADLSKAGISAQTIQKIGPMVKAGPAGATAPAAVPTPSARTKTPPPAPMGTASASNSAATPVAKSAPATQYKPAVPPPGPGMVWVNLDSKVYHLQGQRWYGNTKNGKYMTEQDAMKAGYRRSKD